MRTIILAVSITIILFSGYLFLGSEKGEDIIERVQVTQKVTITVTPSPTMAIISPPPTYIIPQELQVFQSFNNCGPASLSMLLSYHDVNVSQDVVGGKLRPYQNAIGDNDDKSVTLPELAKEAETHNLIAYHRPNGSIDLAKKFISKDIPFIVRTWLNPQEDIGHYRVVRGYDDTTQEFIQDDSYQGGNLRYSYDQFMDMWQPFNYEFLVLIPPEKEDVVRTILAENAEWEIAWQNALKKAQEEQQENPQNPYPVFNQSVAYYHLGNYHASVETYEKVASQLPGRMLWYQIEPIKSYVEVGQYETVFNLTSNILNNQNRGFSELYILRGKAYEAQGNKDMARQEYQQAVFYNQYLEEAQQALSRINST